jgi:hypothetical protein
MTDNLNWEQIEVPQGSFVGWGDKPGQFVLGKVLGFNLTGGSVKDKPDIKVPLLTLELMEPAHSFTRKDGWTQFGKGDLVQLTCALVSLQRAVLTAQPAPGDLVKLTLQEILWGQGQNSGDVKVFDMKIVRGYDKSIGQPAQPSQNGAPSFGAPQQAPAFAQQPANGQPGFAAPSVGAPQQQFAPSGPQFADDAPPF